MRDYVMHWRSQMAVNSSLCIYEIADFFLSHLFIANEKFAKQTQKIYYMLAKAKTSATYDS